MNRLRQALGLGFVLTLYIMCFVFAFECFSAVLNHTGLGQLIADSFLIAALLYAFITFSVYELYKFVDERDRLEAEERARRQAAQDALNGDAAPSQAETVAKVPPGAPDTKQ